MNEHFEKLRMIGTRFYCCLIGGECSFYLEPQLLCRDVFFC